MIRILVSAELLIFVGLLLAPSAWGYAAAAQTGNGAGVALAVIGGATALLLLILGGLRMD